MNSWAKKAIREGHRKGFEFCGFFNKMSVYKNGKLIAIVSSLKDLKSIVRK